MQSDCSLLVNRIIDNKLVPRDYLSHLSNKPRGYTHVFVLPLYHGFGTPFGGQVTEGTLMEPRRSSRIQGRDPVTPGSWRNIVMQGEAPRTY